MARVDPLVRYAVLGVLGFYGYHWALAQPADSPAHQAVDQIRGIFKPATALAAGAPAGGGPAAARAAAPSAAGAGATLQPTVWTGPGGVQVSAPQPIPSGQATIPLALYDLGGVQLALDPNISAIRQDPAQGGTNIYGPGDVVLGADGQQWQIESGRGGPFLRSAGGLLTVDDFRLDRTGGVQ